MQGCEQMHACFQVWVGVSGCECVWVGVQLEQVFIHDWSTFCQSSDDGWRRSNYFSLFFLCHRPVDSFSIVLRWQISNVNGLNSILHFAHNLQCPFKQQRQKVDKELRTEQIFFWKNCLVGFGIGNNDFQSLLWQHHHCGFAPSYNQSIRMNSWVSLIRFHLFPFSVSVLKSSLGSGEWW